MAKSSSKTAKVTKVSKKQESSSSDSDSSSSSSSSSSESSSSESESDSSDSESEAEKKPVAKKAEKKADKKAESSSSESESDSDSSSSSSSDSSDSESESESEDEAPAKEEPKKEAKKEKKEEKKESSSSDSESSSDSDSDSDSSSSSSSSSSSDSDSDSSSDSESETEDQEEPVKRKAESEESEEAPAKKQKTEATPDAAEEPATLFVGRLSWNVDDDWLKREFEPIGGVTSARVMWERATGKSRGYGYVDFESKAAAEKALAEYQGKEIDGRPVNLDLSTGKPQTPRTQDRAKKFGDVPSAPSDTLFIGNLSFNASRDKLFEVFGEHGTVISCRVPTHPDTEQPKGFGYVQFSSVEEAQGALNALNGEYIEGRACRLDFSTPKDPSSRPGSARGGRGGFGGRGGRGGFSDRGGRGGFGGRERSATPTRTGPNSAQFQGKKKTFD